MLNELTRELGKFGYPCASVRIRLDDKGCREDQALVGKWAADNGVHAVFEIDQCIVGDQGWPDQVLHIAWLQDILFAGRNIATDFSRSDLIYFIMPPRLFGIIGDLPPRWSVLMPAARKASGQEDAPAQMRFDFSFAGFIPDPFIETCIILRTSEGRDVSLVEFLSDFPLEHFDLSAYVRSDILKAVEARALALDAAQWAPNWSTIFEDHLPRALTRKRLIEDCLEISQSVGIFGPDNWSRWPQFKPYYFGFISNTKDLDPIYRASRINLHNAQLGMHFRAMDCMAAGGFLFKKACIYDDLPGGMHEYLCADVHYAEFTGENFGEKARFYLENDDLRARIAKVGQAEILASHDWSARVRQILQDLGLPARAASSPTTASRMMQASLSSFMATQKGL